MVPGSADRRPSVRPEHLPQELGPPVRLVRSPVGSSRRWAAKQAVPPPLSRDHLGISDASFVAYAVTTRLHETAVSLAWSWCRGCAAACCLCPRCLCRAAVHRRGWDSGCPPARDGRHSRCWLASRVHPDASGHSGTRIVEQSCGQVVRLYATEWGASSSAAKRAWREARGIEPAQGRGQAAVLRIGRRFRSSTVLCGTERYGRSLVIPTKTGYSALAVRVSETKAAATAVGAPSPRPIVSSPAAVRTRLSPRRCPRATR